MYFFLGESEYKLVYNDIAKNHMIVGFIGAISTFQGRIQGVVHHDITEILLKVVLNTIKQPNDLELVFL